MSALGNHPDSGSPFHPVPRAENPLVKVHDLAMLEFAGPDAARAKSFFTGFGLTCSQGEEGSLQFSAEAGAPVAVVYREAPKPEFLGPTFAVKTVAELQDLATGAKVAPPAPMALPGSPPGVVLTDPNGLQVKVAYFDDWKTLPDCEPLPPSNRGQERSRVNAPIRPRRGPSRVLRLGHMVLGTPKWELSARFYIDTLGLIPSDVQALPDGRPAVTFMRCDRGDEPTDHHTFVVARLPVTDMEHAAFEVPDLDDIGMGGVTLKEKGFHRAWGIGRHILGSQIFDYWFGPDGCKFEHFADGDLFDASRPTGYHAMSTAGLSQWGPEMPQAFIRPRLSLREFGHLLRNLFGKSDFGFRELRQMLKAFGSKSLPS